MITIRPAATRGYSNHGWLESYHSFSFAHYYDPEHMGFSVLRVLNQDRVAPDHGFPSHGHQNMEIISYVLEGALAHRDSLGNGSVIQAGEVQRMSAGTGIIHSEYNASPSEELRFLQIWLLPNQTGIAPSYEQRQVEINAGDGFVLIASPHGARNAVLLHQDAYVSVAKLKAGESLTHNLSEQRAVYLHVAAGQVQLSQQVLNEGDAAKLQAESVLNVQALQASELLLFDLPPVH